MDVKRSAEVLWNYLKLNQDIKKCDCILVLGSHDTLVAERAAELFKGGMAENLIVTGGFGRFTEGLWKETEAERFSRIMISRGVPENRILLETKASNTGENIRFSRKVLEGAGINKLHRILAVCQPFRERRVYASLKKQWSGPEFRVTSPGAAFEEYCRRYETSERIGYGRFFDLLTGEFQRITEYAEKGYVVSQFISEAAAESYRLLISEGFVGDSIRKN